jgi:hypothetical protein
LRKILQAKRRNCAFLSRCGALQFAETMRVLRAVRQIFGSRGAESGAPDADRFRLSIPGAFFDTDPTRFSLKLNARLQRARFSQ